MQSAFFVEVNQIICCLRIPKYCAILKAKVPDTIPSRPFEEYTLVFFHYPVIKRDPSLCQTLFQRFEDPFILRSVHQHQIDDLVGCHRAYRVDRLLFLVSQSRIVDIGVIQQPR